MIPVPFCFHPGNQGTLIDLAEVEAPSGPPPALAPAPAGSGIPVLPPPPQASGPGRSHSAGQPDAPPGPSSTSNALSLLDEELLCLGAYWRGLLGASGASGEVLGMPRGGPRVLSKGGK